jgi:DNA-binding response OmpR family regulator
MAKRILSVSNSPTLLSGRNEMLAMAGYAVSSPRMPEEAPALLATGDFVAVVIGHSVAGEERKCLIAQLRAISQVPIIFIGPRAGEAEPAADYNVALEENPAALLRALKECLGTSQP